MNDETYSRVHSRSRALKVRGSSVKENDSVPVHVNVGFHLTNSPQGS